MWQCNVARTVGWSRALRLAFVLVAAPACSSSASHAPARVDVSDIPSATELGRPAPAVTVPVPATATAPVPVPATTTEPATTTVPVPATAHNFIAEAELLFRIAACGSDTPLPASLSERDVRIINEHCSAIAKRMAKYRKSYMAEAQPFLATLVPQNIPSTVVYPFGGGDLLSALVAFPKATSIATVSLELAGDPRRITTLQGDALRHSLGALRAQIGGLLSVGSNTSENLSAQQRNDLPGQVSSFMLGLATVGATPVAMRYFAIADDGSLRYLADADITAADTAGRAALASRRKASWQSPNFSEAFANVEIEFRMPGETNHRVHRHIGWNLANDYLAAHPQLIAFFGTLAQPRVTVLVKGASYLLWRPDFATIRSWLLANLAWMLSDSTGIPPRFAQAAGMTQTTYGYYDGAFLAGAEEGWPQHTDDFRHIWRTQPHRRLPFRFGYVDAHKQAHLVVTAPGATAP